jgi:hypothetical protein
LVVGSLAFHHFGHGIKGLVLVRGLPCIGRDWIGLNPVGLAVGPKGLETSQEAGCGKCQACMCCQWSPLGMISQS